MKNIFNQLLLLSFLFVIILNSCSNKTSTYSFASQEFRFPPLDSLKKRNKVKIGRKLIHEKAHAFLMSLKLPPYRVDKTPQKILLIGDSMSKWLRYRLEDYCKENGHQLSTVTWVSGNTEWFAQYDTLDYYIKKDSITYVFLVLGANELFIKDFPKHRATCVEKILGKLSTVTWIWVGPPNWKNDKGINKYLLNRLGDEKFFLSKNLKFKRQRDGMHPTVSSCSMWVDSVVSWISNTSTSKIRLNVPDTTYGLKPDAIVLKPLE